MLAQNTLQREIVLTRIEILAIISLLISAFLNPVLRINPDSPYTVFRICAPLLVAYFVLLRQVKINVFLIFFILGAYNIVINLLSPYPLINSMLYLIHYLYLFSVFFILDLIFSNSKSEFCKNNLFNKLFLFMFSFISVLIGAKWIFKLSFFYNYDYSFYHSGYFKNVNDLGAVLSVLCFYFWGQNRVHFVTKAFITLIAIFINYYNDSKAALLAMVLSAAIFSFFWLQYKFKKWLYAVWIFCISGIILFFTLAHRFNVQLKDGPFSLNLYIIEPIRRIFWNDPYARAGSVFDRVDVAIFAIQHYFSSFGAGIGIGNSIHLLQNPDTSTATAKSLHNFLLEQAIELGWLYFIIIFWLVAKIYQQLFTKFSPVDPMLWRGKSFILIFFSLPFLAMPQSSGYISNYLFWSIIFCAFIEFKNECSYEIL